MCCCGQPIINGQGGRPGEHCRHADGLAHLCDVQGLDFGECDRIAHNNYLPEMATQSMDVD
jgi:hypothetical protein